MSSKGARKLICHAQSRLEIVSYYGKWATFWPREEERVAATLKRGAVKMRSGCDSHFKPFWMFCFWHLNARPSHTKSGGGGRAHNWFWRSYLGKPRDYELFKRGQFYRQIKITCFSSELFCILIASVWVCCHLLNQTLCSAQSISNILQMWCCTLKSHTKTLLIIKHDFIKSLM